MRVDKSVKLIGYFKSFENEKEYMIVEIEGVARLFEAQGKIEIGQKDKSTRLISGC